MESIKALVLLSGGLDSVYNLYAANKKWPGKVTAVIFNYGQKAWTNELQAAQFFSRDLSVDLQTIDIKSVFKNVVKAHIPDGRCQLKKTYKILYRKGF